MRLSLALSLALLVHAFLQEPLHFESEECGIEFLYPANWRVELESRQPPRPCHFRAVPLAWDSLLIANDSVDLHWLAIASAQRPLDSVATDFGFELRGDVWFALGLPGVSEPLDSVRGPGWTGVRGSRTTRCNGMGSVIGGVCEAPAAVVTSGGRSVTLGGGPQAGPILTLVLSSLRVR